MDRIWWVGPSIFYVMGRGPARPIMLSEDGLRPAPAHRIIKFPRHGPAWPTRLSNMPVRPCPANNIGGEAHETRGIYGLVRHLCRPARGFDGAGYGAAHLLSRTKVKAYVLTYYFR